MLGPMDLFDSLGPTVRASLAHRRATVTRHYVLAADAAQQMAAHLADAVKGRRVVALADVRTARAAAEPCLAALRARGFDVQLRVLPDRDGHGPVCDDVTAEGLRAGIRERADLILGIGSGVLSDLAKWVAFELDVPSAVYATAASMNGYSAANVAPAIRGVKSLVSARSHWVVAADPAVLAAAPLNLTTAGLGDVVAKWVSTADWRMNQVLFAEPYDEAIAGIIDHVEEAYLANPAAIAARDPNAIGALFTALVFSGCAMTLQGSSMPASGGEHLISHALDMRAMAENESHDLHGRQVGVGTIVAAGLYRHVLAQPQPAFQALTLPLDRQGWGTVAGAVAEHHGQQTARMAQAVEQLRAGDTWQRLREILAPMIPEPGHIKRVLAQAGAAHRIDQLGIDRARFCWAVLNGAQMRERFTSLDLAWVAGSLPGALSEIVDGYVVHD